MTLSDNAQKIYDWFIGAPFHIILILAIALIFQKIGGRAVARAINRIDSAGVRLTIAETVFPFISGS